MVITEGEGTIVDDGLARKKNGKGRWRIYVHFWPKQGARVHALEMDAATFISLYQLRMQQPLPGAVLRVTRTTATKPGSVVFDGELLTPPTGLVLVDLPAIARIRTMAEGMFGPDGSSYEEKALKHIVEADGDTLYLVQVAEALAAALAAASAGPGQTAVSPS